MRSNPGSFACVVLVAAIGCGKQDLQSGRLVAPAAPPATLPAPDLPAAAPSAAGPVPSPAQAGSTGEQGSPSGLTDAQIVQILVLANEALVDEAVAAAVGDADPAVLGFAEGMLVEHRPALERARALALLLGSSDSAAFTTLLIEVADDREDLAHAAGCRRDERYLDKQVTLLSNLRAVFRDVLSPNVHDGALASELAALAPRIDTELTAVMGLHAAAELGEAACEGGGATGGTTGDTTGQGGSVGTGAAGGATDGGSGDGSAGSTGGATGGASGGGGTSPDAGACQADPATTCAGSMNGTWCTDHVLDDPTLPPFSREFKKIWSDSPTNTWLVGEDLPPGGIIPTPDGSTHALIAHWDGCVWTRATTPAVAGLLGVWGANAHDVWAVGREGTALHWDGSTWASVAVPTQTILPGVSGTSGADVWIVGGPGLWHWDGTTWTPSPPVGAAGDLWAGAPNSVWATTGGANVVHFDGTTFTTVQAGEFTNFGLFAIWADATTAWAVGEGNQIAHLTGGTWQHVQQPSGSSQGLVDVMAVGTDVYAVGQSLLHATGSGPFQSDPDAPAGAFYSGVWMTPTQVWLVGSDVTGRQLVMHRSR